MTLFIRKNAPSRGHKAAFAYRVEDGHGGADTQTVALQVVPSADPASTPQTPPAGGLPAGFDALAYIASYPELIAAFGTDADAAARHDIEHGRAEGRPAQGFDALRYIASNPDLIQAFGPDVQAAEIHYVRNGYAENRSLTAFDPAAYLASHPEIATEFGTSDAAVELAYIKRSTSTAAEAGGAAGGAAADGEAPIAVAMLAAGMTGSQAQGIDSGFHDASSGTASGLLAAGDGGLSTRQRTELPG